MKRKRRLLPESTVGSSRKKTNRQAKPADFRITLKQLALNLETKEVLLKNSHDFKLLSEKLMALVAFAIFCFVLTIPGLAHFVAKFDL